MRLFEQMMATQRFQEVFADLTAALPRQVPFQWLAELAKIYASGATPQQIADHLDKLSPDLRPILARLTPKDFETLAPTVAQWAGRWFQQVMQAPFTPTPNPADMPSPQAPARRGAHRRPQPDKPN